MARKEDKLRPYRVDYFDINEMQLPDKALVQSVIVRAVTATEAIDEVANSAPPDLRIIVRAYRFYKKLGVRKTNVYKAVEDLFTANKAVQVMQTIESYRAGKDADAASARRSAELEAAQCPFGYPSGPNGTAHDCKIHKVSDWSYVVPGSDGNYTNGHITRYSDSSLYDEVCTLCGATDASGKLDQPCPSKVIDPDPKTWSGGLKIPIPTTQQQVIDVYQTKVPDDVPLPTSGPDSIATQAVIADLDGMTAHDTHEQIMDTFVPLPGQGADSVDKSAQLSIPPPPAHTPFLTTCPVCDGPCKGDYAAKKDFPIGKSLPYSDPTPETVVRGLGFPDPALPQDWADSQSHNGNVNPSSDPANYVLTSTGDTGAKWKEPGMPLWAKLSIFGVLMVSILLIVNLVLSCPGK
jgi:hypothetical protein